MKKELKNIRRALMTGVSYMLPFIVVAGLTIAGTGILTSYFSVANDVVTALNGFAWTIMGFIPPIFGAYVSYALADKAGIAPGFIGGWIAANPISESTSASGFLGGLIAGLIAGYLVNLLKKLPIPEIIDSLKPTLIIPLVSSLTIYFLMAYPVGILVGGLNDVIINGLLSLAANPSTAFILGAILSGMCALDMGGPLGKIALTFVFAVWADPSGLGFLVNAAVFPGIMVPAIASGCGALIAPKKYTKSERDSAVGVVITGLVGITEGTLPYAFRDPLRVIGSNVIGAAIGGAMMMSMNISCSGVSGIVGIPTANDPLMFTLCIAVGAVVATVLQVLLKKEAVEKTEEEEVDFEIEF